MHACMQHVHMLLRQVFLSIGFFLIIVFSTLESPGANKIEWNNSVYMYIYLFLFHVSKANDQELFMCTKQKVLCFVPYLYVAVFGNIANTTFQCYLSSFYSNKFDFLCMTLSFICFPTCITYSYTVFSSIPCDQYFFNVILIIYDMVISSYDIYEQLGDDVELFYDFILQPCNIWSK